MTFRVSFVPPSSPRSGRTRSGGLEVEDQDDETAIIEGCSLLADVGGSEFRMSGFGRSQWPLDVGYDMSAFLESLPELMNSLRSRAPGEVDLYPQGIECSLTFLPSGSEIEIRCHSRTDWVPSPELESTSYGALVDMLTQLARSVATALGAIDSRMVERSPFDRWLLGDV